VTRYYNKGIKNAPVRRRSKPDAAKRMLAILLTSGLLAAGFIYAIYQRTEAVTYGYKTQQLLREREQLEREKHQLELQRAAARSPQVIEQAARRLGLVRPDSSQVVVADHNGELKRWVPGPAWTAAPGGSAESNTLLVPMNKSAAKTRSPRPPTSEIMTETADRPLIGTTDLARSRPKRIEATDARAVVDSSEPRPADRESSGEVKRKTHLEGVLVFPRGESDLNLGTEPKQRKSRPRS